MKGVRGVVDRRTVDWSKFLWDPASSRESHIPGIFELDKFAVEDLVVTVLSPAFRPYTISVFSADLPLFRQEWILFDIMSADSVVGMFDNCLFSIHKVGDDSKESTASRWLLPPNGPWSSDFGQGTHVGTMMSSLQIPTDWKSSKVSRLRVDGVPIDFFNHGATGPFRWLTSGSLDMDVRIQIPRNPDFPKTSDDVLGKTSTKLQYLRANSFDKIEAAIGARPYEDNFRVDLGNDQLIGKEPLDEDIITQGGHNASLGVALPLRKSTTAPRLENVRMLVDVRLNNLKASVPLQADQISYLASAMIRPIVAYMNANRTSIPLSFTGEVPMVGEAGNGAR